MTKPLKKFILKRKQIRKPKIRETIAKLQAVLKVRKKSIWMMLIVKTYLMMTVISKCQKNLKFQKLYLPKQQELWLFWCLFFCSCSSSAVSIPGLKLTLSIRLLLETWLSSMDLNNHTIVIT